MKVRYAHTIIFARHWKRVDRFYVDVFGGTEKPPERDYSGDYLTVMEEARMSGIHLLLLGYAE